MPNNILAIGLLVAMLALLATSSDETALSDEIGTGDDTEALNNFLKSLIVPRADRSWRQPCEGNSCFQSGGRGWKRANTRGASPYSMGGMKCIGDSCDRGWKRTAQKKR